jgi:hypothetical protein
MQWQNDDQHEKTIEIMRKTCSSATSSTMNFSLSHLGLNTRICSEKPMPRCLNYDIPQHWESNNIKVINIHSAMK